MPKKIEFSPTNASNFHVLAKTDQSEIASMVLESGEVTGGPENRHQGDQWLYVVSGRGEAWVEGETMKFKEGQLLLIQAGERHEIRNTGQKALKTLNFYSIPEF